MNDFPTRAILGIKSPAPIVPVLKDPQGVERPDLAARVAQFIERCTSVPGDQKNAKQRTQVLFVLDSSGSMQAGKHITIAGFNQQVDVVREMAQDAGQTSVTLITFSSQVRQCYTDKPAQALEHLTDASYRVGGGTALLDAVGAAIETAIGSPQVTDPNTAVLIAIFTDGEENASRYMTGDMISEGVRALEATGRFTFTLMGPNEHLESLADMLKIQKGNVARFDAATDAGRARGMGQMAAATSAYMALRSTGAMASTCLYSEPRDAQPSV